MAKQEAANVRSLAMPFPFSVDEAGKVIVADRGTMVIDGVRITMEVLVLAFNPVPGLFYQAERKADATITVRQWTREQLMRELAGERSELERGFAYSYATQVIEGACRPVGPDGESWWDVNDAVQLAEPDVTLAVAYLESRGLLDRHPEQAHWVSLRDESEAAVRHG